MNWAASSSRWYRRLFWYFFCRWGCLTCGIYLPPFCVLWNFRPLVVRKAIKTFEVFIHLHERKCTKYCIYSFTCKKTQSRKCEVRNAVRRKQDTYKKITRAFTDTVSSQRCCWFPYGSIADFPFAYLSCLGRRNRIICLSEKEKLFSDI